MLDVHVVDVFGSKLANRPYPNSKRSENTDLAGLSLYDQTCYQNRAVGIHTAPMYGCDKQACVLNCQCSVLMKVKSIIRISGISKSLWPEAHLYRNRRDAFCEYLIIHTSIAKFPGGLQIPAVCGINEVFFKLMGRAMCFGQRDGSSGQNSKFNSSHTRKRIWNVICKIVVILSQLLRVDWYCVSSFSCEIVAQCIFHLVWCYIDIQLMVLLLYNL